VDGVVCQFKFRVVVFAAISLTYATNSTHGQPRADDQNARAVAELRREYASLTAEFEKAAPGWRPKSPEVGSLLFTALDEYAPGENVGDEFVDVRLRHADDLFILAKRAADLKQPSLAFQFATEAVRENPDHAEGRRVLGYEQRGDRWLTPYGIRMAEAGKTWHPKFGWVRGEDIPHLEKGERQVGKRWTDAAADSARHRDMKSGWQVRTDHFQVVTNHSLEAAAELAARLEGLFQVWRQLFAGYYLGEPEVARLFDGGRDPRKQVRPFRVYYHRDRDQYIAALRRRQPLVSKTLGIYFDTFREAHFFAGDEHSDSTLFHEAVHQLFQESKPTPKKPIAVTRNFWVIEGIATYFETLTEHQDAKAGLYYTVGEPTAGRLPGARAALGDGFYIPVGEFTKLGKNLVQRNPDVAKLYSQSSGLAAFLMDGERGRYREPLVRYLEAIYTGRDDDNTLATETETSYADLDAAYRRHMESLPKN